MPETLVDFDEVGVLAHLAVQMNAQPQSATILAGWDSAFASEVDLDKLELGVAKSHPQPHISTKISSQDLAARQLKKRDVKR